MEKKDLHFYVGASVLLSGAVGMFYLFSGKRYPSVRHVPLNDLILELTKRLVV